MTKQLIFILLIAFSILSEQEVIAQSQSNSDHINKLQQEINVSIALINKISNMICGDLIPGKKNLIDTLGKNYPDTTYYLNQLIELINPLHLAISNLKKIDVPNALSNMQEVLKKYLEIITNLKNNNEKETEKQSLDQRNRIDHEIELIRCAINNIISRLIRLLQIIDPIKWRK